MAMAESKANANILGIPIAIFVGDDFSSTSRRFVFVLFWSLALAPYKLPYFFCIEPQTKFLEAENTI